MIPIEMKFVLFVILIDLSLGQQTTNGTNGRCLSSENECGLKCYSNETHKCHSGLICLKDEEGRCGKQCFNLEKEKCIWGLICLKSEIWCQNQCINPTIQKCHQKRFIQILTKNI